MNKLKYVSLSVVPCLKFQLQSVVMLMMGATVSQACTCAADCLQCSTVYRSTVSVNLQDRNLEWFPRLRAMSLAADEGEGEQIELRTLQAQLEKTQALVANLSQQLTELRDQV